MKCVLLLIGSSLLLVNTVYAQVGLRAGANLAHLLTTTPSYYLEADSRANVGYQVGIYYQVRLGKRLALLPEVQFSRERTHLTTRDNNFTIPEYFGRTDSHLSLSYLTMPVLLRATLGPVYVEVGPQASVLVGGRESGTATISVFDAPFRSTAITRSATDNLQRFDVGPCAGIGVKLPAGLGLSVRAYQGLVSLARQDDPQQAYPYNSRLRRQSLQASLTYQLAARQ